MYKNLKFKMNRNEFMLCDSRRKFGDEERRDVIPRGKEARLILDYNAGMTIDQISNKHFLPAQSVQHFLETRKGYPGKKIQFDCR